MRRKQGRIDAILQERPAPVERLPRGCGHQLGKQSQRRRGLEKNRALLGGNLGRAKRLGCPPGGQRPDLLRRREVVECATRMAPDTDLLLAGAERDRGTCDRMDRPRRRRDEAHGCRQQGHARHRSHRRALGRLDRRVMRQRRILGALCMGADLVERPVQRMMEIEIGKGPGQLAGIGEAGRGIGLGRGGTVDCRANDLLQPFVRQVGRFREGTFPVAKDRHRHLQGAAETAIRLHPVRHGNDARFGGLHLHTRSLGARQPRELDRALGRTFQFGGDVLQLRTARLHQPASSATRHRVIACLRRSAW